MNRYVAIIPARGGSKRLPGKNLMNIAGKPLIAWTIQSALECGFFDRVLVNTDHEEIAETATRFGADVPFIRPDELARDKTTTVDVLIDAVKQMGYPDNIPFSHLACLQPTSPLRKCSDIASAIEVLEANEADAVISVCENEHSPLWSNTLPADNSLKDFIPPNIQKTPSQNLPSYYRLNGAIYVCDIDRMVKEETLFLPDRCYAYIMSRKNSIDIDDKIDFDLAEIYLSQG